MLVTRGYEQQKYSLLMEYDNLHNIVSKEQLHQKAPGQSGGIFTDILATTYRLDYAYEPTNKPHAPRTIVDKPYVNSTGNDIKTKMYDYDANGNLTAITQKTGESDVVEKLRTNLWDEENRLRAVDITPDAEGVRPIAIYTYDAGGERIIKHSNTSVSIYLNGKKVADTIQVNATLYPSGMLVARVIPSDSEESTGGLGYTKHYYAGTQRVSSKIGTTENLGDFLQDWFTGGTGGPIDVIGSSFGVLENAEEGVIQVYEEFDIEPPTYESTPVFIPVASFIHGDDENEIYWFHPDHLGSTSYITNLLGEVSQHMEYFAFGETFVEEHRSSNNSPYKFNGKELDEETGWYYYGARYYDPRISVWLSVDPLANVDYLMNDEAYINGEHNGGVFNSFNHNSYAYTYQNPVVYYDPNGKQNIFTDLWNKVTHVNYNYTKGEGGDIGKMLYIHSGTRKTTTLPIKEDKLATYSINGLKRVIVDRYLSNKSSSKTTLPKTSQKGAVSLLKHGTDIIIEGKIKNVGQVDISNWYGSFSYDLIDGSYSNVDFKGLEPAGIIHYLTDDSILEYNIFLKNSDSDEPIYTTEYAKGAKEINRIFKLAFPTEEEINNTEKNNLPLKNQK